MLRSPDERWADELELVHKDNLEDRRGTPSPTTMDAIDTALRHVLALH